MSNYKLEYKLIQQTPLIHFQHDQSGATLRASEVKPKLDKFIIKKLGGIEALLNDEHLSWFIEQPPRKDGKYIAPEHIALNYKMRIVANGDAIVSEYKKYAIMAMNSQNSGSKKEYNKKAKKEINGMYFGNQGNKPEDLEHYKETVFYKEPIDLSIVCGIEELKNVIDECIAEFFTVTNFGTRQSKGFGGYICSKTESVSTDKVYNLTEKSGLPFFYYIFTDYTDDCAKTIMDTARVVYSVMKSGINETGYNSNNDSYTKEKNYIKGYLLRQYIDDNISSSTGSDKAFMKSNVISQSNRKEPKVKYDSYTFVRALLGLADHYEFRDDMRRGNVSVFNFENMEVNPDQNKIINIPIDDIKESKGIARFKSPVTIKVFIEKSERKNCCSGRVYFLFDDSFKETLGKSFIFINNEHLKDNSKKRENLIKYGHLLTVPDDFDVKKFIDNFVKYYNDNKNVFGVYNINDKKITFYPRNNGISLVKGECKND